MRRLATALLGAGLLLPAAAMAECSRISHAGTPYTVCTATRDGPELRLWLNAPDGTPWGDFARLDAALRAEGLRLGFAMNGGMYHPDRRPVGHYAEDGATAGRLVLSEGPGNFGMLPNGVFCIGTQGFAVIESRQFAEQAPDCHHATQSGPLLLIDGALHPRFIPGSSARLIRNGVGVSPDGTTAWLAISERGVNFHDFATLFRDLYGARDALYLDGNVSRLHAPELGRSDRGRAMGPILGTVMPVQ